jgi:hypothetical protein
MTVTINGSGSITEEITIDGVKVGQGGGNVATNTAVGAGALAANTTGGSTAIGYNALNQNTTGAFSTAVGVFALETNNADQNVAVGQASLRANTTGQSNTATGNTSLRFNTTGSNNAAFGNGALNANTTASNNTAVGYQALFANTTASESTAVGYQAGYTSTGTAQTFIGYKAGYAVSSGTYNCYVGYQAGVAATTGSYNTFVGGINSGYLVTTGAGNTIIGCYSGNQGGLDIRTASNHIVLSDGDGNPRQIIDGSGNVGIGIAPNGFFTAKANIYGDLSGYSVGVINAGNNINRKGLAIAAGTYDSSGTSTMVEFFDGDGNGVGSITNAGGTVSYNAFLGAHYTEVQGETTALVGTVYDSVDELVQQQYSKQDRLPKAKVSDTVESTSVYGVYFGDSGFDDKTQSITGILVASVGAGWVRIAQGVTVQKGDLLVSNGDGCAKVQSDDIIRSKTIGKVVSSTIVETYPDGSYIVPTVLYCG